MKLRTMFLAAVSALIMTGVTSVYAENTSAGPKTAKPVKASKGDLEKKSQEVLQKYDKDGDGKLSEAELGDAKKDKINDELIKALSSKKTDAKKPETKK